MTVDQMDFQACRVRKVKPLIVASEGCQGHRVPKETQDSLDYLD